MNAQAEWLIYIMKVVGIPYLWGGKDASKGLDCSGFTQYCLDFMGINPAGEHNAQSLYNIFSKEGHPVPVPGFGDLLFFGTAGHIHHVAIALNEEDMVEAAHGNETITSAQIAFQKGARVMVTKSARMKDLFAIIRPEGYPWVDDGVSSLMTRAPSNQGQGQSSSQGLSTRAAQYQTH